jgi:pyruvate dehydrogenase E2 component (dihydrolipoyllysine-residue acetyltransferase)
MPQVFMPRLSDTMTEGTVSTWTKGVGDRIEKGDVIAEIETDKATMELEAYDAGVLEQILVGVGTTVPIGEIIAVIGDGSGAAAPVAAAPAVAATAEPAASAVAAIPAPAAATAAPTVPSAAANGTPSSSSNGTHPLASPLARTIARDAGLDLATISGSGPGGRIVRADVQDAIAALAAPAAPAAPTAPTRAAVAAPAAAPAPAAVAPPIAAVAPAPIAQLQTGPDDEEIALNNVRRITARRLVESMQQAPHFYLTSVVAADELVAARARINEGLTALAAGHEGAAASKISVNDLVVKAVATALRAHPEVNVSFGGDKLIRHHRVHVGIAVALPDGLIVPVIRDADTKTVTQISAETRDLATRARGGKLKPDEFTGGTFSVSNLGMFGVDQFTAVINPPEAAILAVGATKQEPVVRDGQVVVGYTMAITLSVDHRALDGATGAKFLADLTALLENPLATLA